MSGGLTEFTKEEFNQLPRFYVPIILNYLIFIPRHHSRAITKESQLELFKEFEDQPDLALLAVGVISDDIPGEFTLTSKSQYRDKGRTIVEIFSRLSSGPFIAFMGMDPFQGIEALRGLDFTDEENIQTFRVIQCDNPILGYYSVNIAFIELGVR
jgi:hypothetical protein